jgi:hypothetical protein
MCGKYIGSGQNEHGRYSCPEMSKEMKQQLASKKQRLDAEKELYDKEINLRRKVAVQNIKSNKYPDRLQAATTAKTWLDKADRTCPICDFTYKPRSDPTKDLNWHAIAYKRCSYCPFADTDETRARLAAEWQVNEDKRKANRNSTKRQKRVQK